MATTTLAILNPTGKKKKNKKKKKRGRRRIERKRGKLLHMLIPN